ncbi:leucyl aminopeptidase family protein [Ahrensia kielensis]|uniref:Leucyl aminopeptidase family protein n=1 Tax=Ahrensia kielensis TaxID=76980 RepID=A0ABU9T9R3_9HYPH
MPLQFNQYSVNPNGKLTAVLSTVGKKAGAFKLNNIFVSAAQKNDKILPVHCVAQSDLDGMPSEAKIWADLNGFDGAVGNVLLVPAENGQSINMVLLGVGDATDPFVTGALAKKLPNTPFTFASLAGLDLRLAAIGFGLGSYRFDVYKKSSQRIPQLVLGDMLDRDEILRHVESSWLARDLINTPAEDMGPDEIEAASRKLAKSYKASIKIIKGDALLSNNFPMIHAVGRAATKAPRLIDFTWGDKKAPKLTLVGKGVAFDTGGLDIKPASSMRNMKKDMGGAANILALARIIMDAKLNVRLRVLIPAVENAIAGNAFRPGDILRSRKGLTVEIGHTDAEGRLVLGDALTLASEEKPDLIIDMATLTGAARVALGPELPPYYTNDEALAAAVDEAAVSERDPLWRMPLWQNYNQALASTVADLNNVTTDGFAGSITAGLFLQRFVDPAVSWAHFDIFGWNPSAKPHSPVGGEAQGIRAIFASLQKRYA